MLNHKGTQDIETERLLLRKFRISDAVKMFENYAADERVTKYLTWTPYASVEDVKYYINSVIESYVYDNTYYWVIIFNDEIIGSISTVAIDEKNHNCEIGYCIGYEYWNKGITTEALAAVMNYLFAEVGVHKIIAKHDVENPASGEVMKKCNMVCEGRFRKHFLRHDGTYSDALIYGILKEEWDVDGIIKMEWIDSL